MAAGHALKGVGWSVRTGCCANVYTVVCGRLHLQQLSELASPTVNLRSRPSKGGYMLTTHRRVKDEFEGDHFPNRCTVLADVLAASSVTLVLAPSPEP